MTNDPLSSPYLAHALTDTEGRFLSVDDHFCELLRLERKDVLGRTILDITVERDRPANAEKLDLLRDRCEPFVIRKGYICGDGHIQPVENSVSLARDGLSGEIIVASVRSVAPASENRVAALAETARGLLNKQRRLQELGAFFSERGWSLLLAAYVLEAEGSRLLVNDLCELVGLQREACYIQIWSLISSGLLKVDGKPVSITHSGVRLSAACNRQIEQYLLDVRIEPR